MKNNSVGIVKKDQYFNGLGLKDKNKNKIDKCDINDFDVSTINNSVDKSNYIEDYNR